MPRGLIDKLGWLLAGVTSLIALGLLAGVVHGGPLDPPGSPAGTMKTLDEIPGSWSRPLNSGNGAPGGSVDPPAGCDSDRFKCVLSNIPAHDYPAVLDVETGLVWQRVSSAPNRTWANSVSYCQTLELGQRRGWRLPTEAELASIVNVTSGFFEMPGVPFGGFAADEYWTRSSLSPGNSAIGIVNGGGGTIISSSQTSSQRALCVRGPGGDDGL